MLTTLRSRLASKTAVLGLAAVLLGGGVAVAATDNLPAPAQEAMARVAAQIGINISNGDGELPEEAVAGQATADTNQAFAEENQEFAEQMAANAQMFAGAVEETIVGYTTVLDVWTGCVAEEGSERGSTQSDSGTRTEEEFDLTAECGEKPVLVIPDPAGFGLADPEDGGPPSDVPLGPPEDVGSSSDVPVGPPSDVPLGPPEGVGPPSDLP